MLERFPFDHEDVVFAAAVLLMSGVALMVFAVLCGIAYRLFQITGGV